jgi:hypothetical protein
VNLEKEIEQIKRRLDRIEATLPSKSTKPVLPGHFTEPKASMLEQGDPYELVDLKVKKSQGIGGPEYDYKLAVRNNGKTSARFDGMIIFLDSSDFEVESALTGPFTVAAGETFTKTGMVTIFDPSHAARIANVTGEIYPQPM